MTDSSSPDDVFNAASGDADLDWGAALAEQAAATPAATEPASVFPQLQSRNVPLSPADLERVLDVPVRLTAELGRTRITIKTLLQLAPGSVVELDGLAGEPMDLFVNGYLIAQGEVVVVGEKYGIRVTDIVTPSERMQKLNR